jgi:hypothetical protein
VTYLCEGGQELRDETRREGRVGRTRTQTAAQGDDRPRIRQTVATLIQINAYLYRYLSSYL